MNEDVHAYWLEQSEAHVPSGDQWLTASERSRLASLRFDKRRREWRLGRWTAKRAVASCLHLPLDAHTLQDVEIRALPSGAPEVLLFQERANLCISVSHRAGRAFCVLGLSGAELGCDLELVERRGDSFVTDFFTASEQKLVNRASPEERPMLVTLVWSAKESALKALKVGLRMDTTSLDVSFMDSTFNRGNHSYQDDRAPWSRLSLRNATGQILRGWWRWADDLVRTVVFSPLQNGLGY